MKDRKRIIRWTFLLAFAFSGMASLIYEVSWVRALQSVFGSTIYAVSTILTTFMVGFTVGSFFFRHLAENSKNPAKIFSLIELCIGVYGIVILLIFKILPKFYILLTGVPFSKILQFFLCFLVVIIPATLFGATWPMINKAYARIEKLGMDVGKLYSANSIGCVFGSLGAGFFLMPLLGIRLTSTFAAIINIIAAILVFIICRRRNET